MLNIHPELDRLLRRTEAAEIRREEFRGSEAMRRAESDDSYPSAVERYLRRTGPLSADPPRAMGVVAMSGAAMFSEKLRHYCRNPRCGSKLKAPVENVREAFCARGCHTQFYRKRCIVCEQPMERKRESQQLCKRRKCKSRFAALKAHSLLGRYHPSSHVLDASKNPTKPGTFWRQVAGPPGGRASRRDRGRRCAQKSRQGEPSALA